MNRSTVRRRVWPAALAGTAALCAACGGGTQPLVTSEPTSATTSATTTTTSPTTTATMSPAPMTTTSAAPTASTTAATGSTTTRGRTSATPSTAISTTDATGTAGTVGTAGTAGPRTRRPRTTTAPTTSTTAAKARCQAGQVRAAIAEDDAGAGQRYATLTLRNVGSTRCAVAAYSRLQLLTGSGSTVPTRVVPAGAGRRVTLRPGARATAQLHWSTVPGPGDPSADRCPATPNRVRVVPGGDAGPVTVSWGLGPVCGGGRIDAEPLRAG